MNQEHTQYRPPLVRDVEYDFITVDPVADDADNRIHVSWYSQGPTRITSLEFFKETSDAELLPLAAEVCRLLSGLSSSLKSQASNASGND